MKKRILSLLLAVSMSVGMIATATAAAEATEGYMDFELKEEWIKDPSIGDVTGGPDGKKTKVTARALNIPNSVSPFITFAAYTDFLYALYEPMWATEPGATEEMGVIFKDWTWTDDYTLVANMYDYIHDTNGNELKASDVIFSIEKWKEAGITSTSSQIDSVEATGEYEVTFHFNIKYYFGLLTSLTCFVVTQKAYEESPDGMATTPVGTGPYKLREFVSGSHVIMEQTYDHWQKDQSLIPTCMRAHVDVVQLDVITEEGQYKTALDTGTIQASVVTGTNVREITAENAFNIYSSIIPSCMALSFNMSEQQNSILKDNQALRQAICYAVDAAGVCAAATNNTGVPSKSLSYNGRPGYLEKWEEEDYYDYNIEKAKELMAEAGYPDGGVTITLLGQGVDPQHQKIAQVVQAQLQQIGVTVETELPDGAVYQSKRMSAPTGEWDICITYNKDCNFVPAGFRMFVGNNYAWGNQLGEDDQDLQELLFTALYSGEDEDIDTLHQYIKDRATLYCLYSPRLYYATDRSIISPITNHEGACSPAAAIFSEDYAIYDE